MTGLVCWASRLLRERPRLVLFALALVVRLVCGAITFGSVDLVNSIESTPRLLANQRTPGVRAPSAFWRSPLAGTIVLGPFLLSLRLRLGLRSNLPAANEESHLQRFITAVGVWINGQWHARWGGEMNDVSQTPGYFEHTGLTSNWGATATGLPLLGGLVTLADLKRGYINHALAIALVETARARYAWPAQRTDGSTFTPNVVGIPEGTRFRLDPRLNIAKLHLSPIDRMLARAAQKYGIVVRDKAGAVVFYGQDPVGQPSNPWSEMFGTAGPGSVLAQFPWSHLEALKSTQTLGWG